MSDPTYQQLLSLIDSFGPDETLQGIKDKCFSHLKYPCPKCLGTGSTEYNAYPNNLPDSGSAYMAGYEECNVCKGEGYTEEKFEEVATQFNYQRTKYK